MLTATTTRRIILLLAALLLLGLSAAHRHAGPSYADEGWVITAFNAVYQINADGRVDVTEQIDVDFGTQSKHGIFRDIPVQYKYDDKHNRIFRIAVQGVDDGSRPVPYSTSTAGANLRIKIGDAGRTVSGAQRYVIHYRVFGSLNAQPAGSPTGDPEFYWNVTGNEWPVSIAAAAARVTAPGINNVTCFQGPTGSTEPCRSTPPAGGSSTFSATRSLPEGNGLTIVVGLPPGSVAAAAPLLVEVKDTSQQVLDYLGVKPLQLSLSVGLGILLFMGLGRYWWLAGRDRWSGDVRYLTGSQADEPRPLMARETIVVEYAPPEVDGNQRALRPAEVGVLMDESADTLDVSATIVDLAVRGYLTITELPKEGLFGSRDYRLDQLKDSDSALLPYEHTLLDSLFEGRETVEMSDLKTKFYSDLAEVKKQLYQQISESDGYFAGNPESVRTIHLVIAFVMVAVGVGAFILLGNALGAAVIGVPVAVAGLVMLFMSRSMPRRTAAGREMYRRTRGFQQYMEVAETDRQRFAEQAGIFEKYLPFAIVFHCTEKWAKAFEGLDAQAPAVTSSGWYVGSGSFQPLLFAHDIAGFSSSISTAIASTPASSGSSGFSGGGGSSGGGGGGGGGGSW